MKTVYLYDDKGVYTEPYQAQENPMQPGQYITPVLSTDIAPPVYENKQIPFFSKGKWTIEADYRDETWYDKSNGDPVVIVDAGTPPSNLQPIPPVFPPTAEQNKTIASGLLTATDWTTIADVADPKNSPYLANQYEFIAYRNLVRQIAVYPTAGDLVWPVKPSEVWL